MQISRVNNSCKRVGCAPKRQLCVSCFWMKRYTKSIEKQGNTVIIVMMHVRSRVIAERELLVS